MRLHEKNDDGLFFYFLTIASQNGVTDVGQGISVIFLSICITMAGKFSHVNFTEHNDSFKKVLLSLTEG